MVDIGQLFYQFFIDPIVNYGNYNIVNTVLYGVILLAISFWFLYPELNKRGIKFDFNFVVALLPYIILGSSARIIEDLRIIGRTANPFDIAFYGMTPGIYIAVAAIVILGLAVSWMINKKIDKKFLFYFSLIGWLFAAPFLAFAVLNFKTIFGLIFAIGLAITITSIIVFASRYLKQKMFDNNFNATVLLAQVMDGCGTYTGLGVYECGEQHVVSGFVIDSFTPFAFIVVKILIAVFILYYLEKEVKDENMKGFIKVIVIVLGFAPGIRNILTTAIGNCFI